MNKEFNQRTFNLIKEGITTGGDPKATGERVGHFIGKTKAQNLSQTQRYHIIRRIASIGHKITKRAGENKKTEGEKYDAGFQKGREKVQTGMTEPKHYETGQHLIKQVRNKANKNVRSMSQNEGIKKEFHKWRAYTNTNMAAKLAKSTRNMQDTNQDQKDIDKEHDRAAKAGNKAYKYMIKLGIPPEQAKTRIKAKTSDTIDTIDENKKSKEHGKKAAIHLARKKDVDITKGPEEILRNKRLQLAAELRIRKGFRTKRKDENSFYQRLTKLITETPIVNKKGQTLDTTLNPKIFIKHKHGANPRAQRRIKKLHHAMSTGKTNVHIKQAQKAVLNLIGRKGSGMFNPRGEDPILVNKKEKEAGQ